MTCDVIAREAYHSDVGGGAEEDWAIVPWNKVMVKCGWDGDLSNCGMG